MPDINFNCPYCQQNINAPEEMAGTTAQCPTCKKDFQVPQSKLKLEQSGGNLTKNASQALDSSPKFVPAKCPSCGGALQVPEGRDRVICMYCGNSVLISSPNSSSNLSEVSTVLRSMIGDTLLPNEGRELKRLLKSMLTDSFENAGKEDGSEELVACFLPDLENADFINNMLNGAAEDVYKSTHTKFQQIFGGAPKYYDRVEAEGSVGRNFIDQISKSQVQDLTICARYLHDQILATHYFSLHGCTPPGTCNSVQEYEDPNVGAEVPSSDWLEDEVIALSCYTLGFLNIVISGDYDRIKRKEWRTS